MNLSRVKCETQIVPPVGIEPPTSCMRPRPRGQAGRRLPRRSWLLAEGRGSNPTGCKICFSHFTLFRVECEEMFCKTNIKLQKVLKLIKISSNLIKR